MNALSSRQLSSVFALACRATGLIMILATIFSMVLLPWPYQLQDREWLLFQFITPVVDRGIISLLGIVLLLASAWVDGLSADKQGNSGKGGLAFGS
ncbi:MAG: hypothetical protein F6K09_25510, partial [Merismopedia sp. SIO2A8]|nr:hypothetical protein [Merismopedia sp. SIO2A8]